MQHSVLLGMPPVATGRHTHWRKTLPRVMHHQACAAHHRPPHITLSRLVKRHPDGSTSPSGGQHGVQCGLDALHSTAKAGASPFIPHAAIAVAVPPRAWVVDIRQGFP